VSLPCGSDEEPVVYPLTVQVYKPQDGWLASRGWEPSQPSGYSGGHGLMDRHDGCGDGDGAKKQKTDD